MSRKGRYVRYVIGLEATTQSQHIAEIRHENDNVKFSLLRL